MLRCSCDTRPCDATRPWSATRRRFAAPAVLVCAPPPVAVRASAPGLAPVEGPAEGPAGCWVALAAAGRRCERPRDLWTRLVDATTTELGMETGPPACTARRCSSCDTATRVRRHKHGIDVPRRLRRDICAERGVLTRSDDTTPPSAGRRDASHRTALLQNERTDAIAREGGPSRVAHLA